MNLKQFKQRLMQDPEFKDVHNRYDLAFEIREMVIYERTKLGLTQKQLAQKIGTKQTSIARLENSTNNIPSLSFLEKIAKALGTYLIAPRFASSLQEDPYHDAKLISELRFNTNSVSTATITKLNKKEEIYSLYPTSVDSSHINIINLSIN